MHEGSAFPCYRQETANNDDVPGAGRVSRAPDDIKKGAYDYIEALRRLTDGAFTLDVAVGPLKLMS